MEKLLVQLTENELKELLAATFAQAISKITQKVEDDKLLTRGEVALLFRVSLVTINSWCKSGKLIAHRMNSRVYFFRSEVMAELSNKK